MTENRTRKQNGNVGAEPEKVMRQNESEINMATRPTWHEPKLDAVAARGQAPMTRTRTNRSATVHYNW